MSLETTVTEVMKILEAGLFKPATPGQVNTRKEYEEKIEKLRIEARRERARAERLAFLDSLPYTYEDIIKLPAYEKIMDLEGVTDNTSDLLKIRRNISFQVDINGWLNEYRVYANGYIRTGTADRPGIIHKAAPALTLEAYGKLLDRLSDTITRYIKSANRQTIYYAYDIYDNDYRKLETVNYKNRVQHDYVYRQLLRDGYSPQIRIRGPREVKELLRENEGC